MVFVPQSLVRLRSVNDESGRSSQYSKFLPRFESEILFLETNVSVNNWSADRGKEEG